MSNQIDIHDEVRKLCKSAAADINRTYIVTQLTKQALDDQHKYYKNRKRPALKVELPDVAGGVQEVKAAKALIEQLLQQSLEYDIYKHALISALSGLEDFMARVIRVLLQSYPERLHLSIAGEKLDKQVKLELVLQAVDLDSLKNTLIETRLLQIFYESPHNYFQHFRTITNFEMEDSVQNAYAEVKATRDVLTHNFGTINSVYLQKAGALSRGRLGQKLALSPDYFRDSLTTLKRIILQVYKESERIDKTKKA